MTMDPHDAFRPKRPPAEQTSGLSLFETAGQVQFPAPIAPGSDTSQEAATQLEGSGERQRQVMLVLAWFAAQSEPRTRYDLADALYHGRTGPACGRVNDLITMGWLEVVGQTRASGKARETLRLTAAGLQRVRDAA